MGVNNSIIHSQQVKYLWHSTKTRHKLRTTTTKREQVRQQSRNEKKLKDPATAKWRRVYLESSLLTDEVTNEVSFQAGERPMSNIITAEPQFVELALKLRRQLVITDKNKWLCWQHI